MINPEEDGITHINIYSKGKTDLGKFLSNFTYSPFKHPEDGWFDSIEGYWYWLLCGDDQLRIVHGFSAKKLGRELGSPDWPTKNLKEFQDKIKSAILLKINKSDKTEQIVYCNFPFDHYYNYNGKIIRPKECKWLIDFFNDLRIKLP